MEGEGEDMGQDGRNDNNDNIVLWRDFNDAGPQDAAEAKPTVQVADIKLRMLTNIRGVLSYLLPGGQFRGNTFVVGDIDGNPGESMSVELDGPRAGLWHDFNTGEGGDVITLWAAVNRKDAKTQFAEVIEDIREWMDGPMIATHRPQTVQKRRKPHMDDLGPHTAKWDYKAPDGRLIACVYRYDPPGKRKQFRPYNPETGKYKNPDVRPLYNLPAVVKSDYVVLVEGEKAADALIRSGVTATTAMGGASAPLDKTDWHHLANKHLTIWPDNDDAGKGYAERAAEYLGKTAASIRILQIPDSKPDKWDAADADNPMSVLEQGSFDVIKEVAVRPWSFDSWRADRYKGKAPRQNFLVEGCFPMKVVSLLAAMGDTGKGMMTLDLALSVATGKPSIAGGPEAFGGPVRQFGTAVIFTAEDDVDEVHRRLERLDPDYKRLRSPERLIVVPLPNAGGPFALVANGRDGPIATPDYHHVHNALMAIDDLKMVVFDPMSSFIHADVTADPAAGSFAMGLLASLATETGAAVIVAHHMRKPQGNKPIATVEQARDAVRGTSALVDGVRCVYALWPMPEEMQKSAFEAVEKSPSRNALHQGAVVKSNGPADRTIRTYHRAPTGLLKDITNVIKGVMVKDAELVEPLVSIISKGAEEGFPFSMSGQNGLFENIHRLPDNFKNVSKHRLQNLAATLLKMDPPRLVKARAKGSTGTQWLDVPGGRFARGDGEFELGSQE
jgi:hypothetical protein